MCYTTGHEADDDDSWTRIPLGPKDPNSSGPTSPDLSPSTSDDDAAEPPLDADEMPSLEEDEIYEVFMPPLAVAPLPPPRIVIDLTNDDSEFYFDRKPFMIMRDYGIRGCFRCEFCRKNWPYQHQLHEHEAGRRHLKMMRFMRGEAMFYCITCDCLPGQPHLHLRRECHRKAVSRLQRPQEPSDFAVRKVVLTAAGHRVASLLFPCD